MSTMSSTCLKCGYVVNHQLVNICPECQGVGMDHDEEIERDDNDGPEDGEGDDDEGD